MSVNKYKSHLTVLLEDEPYRNILNGVRLASNVEDSVIDVKNPCGGWLKVFESLECELKLLNKFPERNILLLIDFDDSKTSDESNTFESRYNKFKELSSLYQDRVFILGVNHKESENLKGFFELNFEDIGKKLVENCPNGNLKDWDNIHLRYNIPEIKQMQKSGVFDWLFKK